MLQFGSDEYGDRDSFKVVCQKCGKEGRVVATHHYKDIKDNSLEKKITVEMRCSCGNRYGATIHSSYIDA